MKRNEDNCQIWNELDTRHLSRFVLSMRANGKSIIVCPCHSLKHTDTHAHTYSPWQCLRSGGKFGFKVNDFLHCLIIFNAQWCSSIELSQSTFALWNFLLTRVKTAATKRMRRSTFICYQLLTTAFSPLSRAQYFVYVFPFVDFKMELQNRSCQRKDNSRKKKQRKMNYRLRSERYGTKCEIWQIH